MAVAFLIAMQASVSPGVPPAPIRFDLATATPPAASCKDRGGSEASTDIVVCGRRRNAHRLVPPDGAVAEPTPLRAETRIFDNVRMSADVESATLPGGTISKRAMLRFKVPF